MQRLSSEVQSRMHGLSDLGDVVGALRAVSAARVQQAHAVLESIRRYTEIIQEALSEACRALHLPSAAPDVPASAGFIVAFGSEHGFVGALNERILDLASARRRPGDELLVVGSRAELIARERGSSVSWSCQTASQVGGIDDVALRLAERLSLAGTGRRIERVALVYTRVTDGAAARVVVEALLPFDAEPYPARQTARPTAISNLRPMALVDGLVDELLFAQLAHATAESFASENAARLTAMQAATDNVADKLEQLARLERELRQEEITTELLDIVTGAAAVSDAEPLGAVRRTPESGAGR